MSNLDTCPAKGFDLRRHSWPDLGDPARKNGKKERKERTIRISTRRFVTRPGPCDKPGQAANDNGRGCPRPSVVLTRSLLVAASLPTPRSADQSAGPEP